MKEKDTTIGQAPIRDARTWGRPGCWCWACSTCSPCLEPRCWFPILVQSYGLPLSTQTTLFFAGFGTLFFHLCTKLEIPAFLGSSFAFLGGFSAMANLDTGKYAAMAPGEKLQYACGGIVVAGLLYVILALVVKVVGVHRVMRFLPPVVTGPIIILIGLNLAPRRFPMPPPAGGWRWSPWRSLWLPTSGAVAW
ncbi:MAG: solute carrier family 23 protein [Evtepia gabavorous]